MSNFKTPSEAGINTQILGKWQYVVDENTAIGTKDPTKEATIEFKDSGDFTMYNENEKETYTVTGTYKFIDTETIELVATKIEGADYPLDTVKISNVKIKDNILYSIQADDKQISFIRIN